MRNSGESSELASLQRNRGVTTWGRQLALNGDGLDSVTNTCARSTCPVSTYTPKTHHVRLIRHVGHCKHVWGAEDHYMGQWGVHFHHDATSITNFLLQYSASFPLGVWFKMHWLPWICSTFFHPRGVKMSQTELTGSQQLIQSCQEVQIRTHTQSDNLEWSNRDKLLLWVTMHVQRMWLQTLILSLKSHQISLCMFRCWEITF